MPVVRSVFAIACLLLTIGFIALGLWQIDRRAWKVDLMNRIARQIHAEPTPLPPRSAWNRDHAYERVRVRGSYLHGAETLVQAVTDRGGGWWVITPLKTVEGTILVNRGFVPPMLRDPSSRRLGQTQGQVVVTGLLRTTEPGGGFLQSNDPRANRWYSRDVVAIAQARRVGRVMPFFLDADATANRGGFPVGGLTVVAFRNNHLAYAITWFTLAALSLGGAWMLVFGRKTDR